MPVEIKIPSPGESITEVEIGSWLKSDGDTVNVDEVLCEIETDKATLPLPAEVSGVLKIILNEGEVANVGDVLCSIDTEVQTQTVETLSTPGTSTPGTSESGANTETSTPQAATESDSYASGHPSVAAQKIMTERKLEANQIKGTGKAGRITKDDAQKAQAPAASVKKETPAPAKVIEKVVPDASEGERGVRRERMSRLRRKVAERLVAIKNETAMLTTFNEVDMKAIFDLRAQNRDAFLKKYGVKLGFMGFFTKAVTAALKDFPAVNAQIDGDDIVYQEFIDIGIAVSAPKGLMVPVIRDADTLTIAEIEQEILRLAKKARGNQLSLEEMSGGTFSITNGGVFGSMLSTPIINPPQSAILGMHNIVERPVAINGEVLIRPIMYLALSYDHRIIDGKESVSFLYTLKNYLENPARMLLGV